MRLIRMSPKDLIDFGKNQNAKKAQYVVVSRDLTVLDSDDNIVAMKELIPPSSIMAEFMNKGYTKKYRKSFKRYLSDPTIMVSIAALATAVVTNKVPVIVLCSEREHDCKYTKVLFEFLKEEFGIKGVSYKKYLRKPNKKIPSKKLKKIKNKVDDIRHKLNSAKITNTNVRARLMSYKAQLLELDKKDLRKLIDKFGLTKKYNKLKDPTKEDIVKLIIRSKRR